MLRSMRGTQGSRPPLEWGIFTATRSLLVTLPPAVLLLLIDGIPNDRLLATVLGHLTVVVAAGVALAVVFTRRLDERWFHLAPGPRERMASAAAAVALVTGTVALTTLASSAALRLDPSLQFLQLLSALDIAWVTAATTIGVTWLGSRRSGLAAGAVMTAFCVWSIWTYLDVVGFGADGSWLVDGAALRRHVLPYDMVAAFVAVTVLILGSRRAAARGRDLAAGVVQDNQV